MITSPSSRQLLETARTELRDLVAPKVDDPAAAASLGMIDWILQTVAARCDNEVSWMREEIAIVAATGDRVVAAGADGDGGVAAALAALRSAPATSQDVPAVQREYDLASEVLSRAVEAALPVGGELRADVEAVLDQRLARELQVRGAFTLPGRG